MNAAAAMSAEAVQTVVISRPMQDWIAAVDGVILTGDQRLVSIIALVWSYPPHRASIALKEFRLPEQFFFTARARHDGPAWRPGMENRLCLSMQLLR